MSKVLIVVDMQNDFVTGPLGTPEAQAIVLPVVDKICQHLNKKNNSLVFTRDSHPEDQLKTQEGKKLPVEHCIHGTYGWDIIPAYYDFTKKTNLVLDKWSFGYVNWKYHLGSTKDIESIELVGVCTDICVISNALILKSLYPEIPIIVDASCCAGTTPENHAAALQVMKCCQIEVINE